MSRKFISTLGGFWSVSVNGYIFLHDKEDFYELTQSARAKYDKDDWLQFLVAISTRSVLPDARLHAAMQADAIKSIQDYFEKDPDSFPRYEAEGQKAAEIAETFLEACTSCPASKGLFTKECIVIDDVEYWILREYYAQSLTERLTNKKREAKKVTIAPVNIDGITGNSTDFRIRVSGEWIRICTEGVRRP